MRELLEGAAPALRGDAAAGGVRAYYRSAEGWTAATFWESSDAGGLRKFPFGLSCVVEGSGTRDVLSGTRAVHERQRVVFEEAKAFEGAEDFEQRIHQIWSTATDVHQRKRPNASTEVWST